MATHKKATAGTVAVSKAKNNAKPDYHKTQAAADLAQACAAACRRIGVIYRSVPADDQWHRAHILGDAQGQKDGAILMRANNSGGIFLNLRTNDIASFRLKAFEDAERANRNRKRTEARFKKIMLLIGSDASLRARILTRLAAQP